MMGKEKREEEEEDEQKEEGEQRWRQLTESLVKILLAPSMAE